MIIRRANLGTGTNLAKAAKFEPVPGFADYPDTRRNLGRTSLARKAERILQRRILYLIVALGAKILDFRLGDV